MGTTYKGPGSGTAGVTEVTDGTNAATGNVELVGGNGLKVAVTPGANGTATITPAYAPAIVAPSGDVTGATDATNIQAAVNAYGYVLLTAGAFHISSTINLPSGTKLVGTGGGQIYNTTANNTVINPIGCTAFSVTNSNTWGLIQDLQINGALASGGAYSGITFPNTGGPFYQAEWTISRVFIQGFTNAGGQGIYFGSGNGGVYVFQCLIYNNYTGINLSGSDAVIDTCVIVVNLSEGIGVGGNITTICNCSIGTNYVGIYLSNGSTNSRNMITDNGINNSASNAIVVDSGGTVITGNVIRSNSTDGANDFADILVMNYAGDNCIISGNTFAGVEVSYNVQFSGAQAAIVVGNSVSTASPAGLGFTNNPANCLGGAGWTGAASPSPGPPGTAVESFISSNFTLTTAGTAYNLTSVTLPPGTWEVTGRASVYTAGVVSIIDLWLGTTSASTTGAYAGSSSAGSATGDQTTVVVTKVITLAVQTVVYLNATGSANGSVAAHTSYTEAVANATGISAVPVSGYNAVVTAKTVSYALLSTDQVVVFTIATGATATLPSATTAGSGVKYTVSNANASTGVLTLAATSGTIPVTTIAAGTSITVISDGTNWQACT